MMDTKGAARREKEAGAEPLVTVDVVIFSLRDDDLQVLLLRHDREPAVEMWAIPGGGLQAGEGLDAAALRILEDETGLRQVYLEQLYTFGQPERVPGRRTIAVAYLALISAAAVVPCADSDAENVRWWSINALPSLAFDHAAILGYALTRLRYKLEYTAVGFELLPATFTLTELQKGYEVILGEALDKRNFRRKILAADIIEPVAGYRSGEGRPARLYRYRPDAVAEVKARRLFP